ncbi:MAG: hypothetical protein H0V89_05910 [Deltaproteobacteria bacterium]|nr:hypothetical protein [Deltaproteobacteria bacterium]
MNLRDLFNDRRWHLDDLAELEIDVIHRGVPGDQRTVQGYAIKRVAPKGLVIQDDLATLSFGDDGEEVVGEGEVFLPFHRVLEVRARSGTLWTKK